MKYPSRVLFIYFWWTNIHWGTKYFLFQYGLYGVCIISCWINLQYGLHGVFYDNWSIYLLYQTSFQNIL